MRNAGRDPEKEDGKRGLLRSPLELIDRANTACAEIATIGALLGAVGQPDEMDREVVSSSGHLIQNRARRLHDCLGSLSAWLRDEHSEQKELCGRSVSAEGKGGMAFTLCLSVQEWQALNEIIKEHTRAESAEAFLEAFVRDLAGFGGSGGDECFRAWMRRRYGPPDADESDL